MSLQTYTGGTAVVKMSSGALLRLAENSVLEVVRPQGGSLLLYLRVGAARLFGRESDDTGLQSTNAVAAHHQTDFEMRVGADDRTEVWVNEGTLRLASGDRLLGLSATATNRVLIQGKSEPVAFLRATNKVQWWLHFPVVLDPADLHLPEPVAEEVRNSSRRYAAGQYAQAVALYPYGRQAESDPERCYAAALRLLASDLPGAESLLRQASEVTENVAALATLMATVRGQPPEEPLVPSTPSGWLAESYRRQAHHDLAGARSAAYAAATNSPAFLAAWVRVAELELGREDVRKARKALAQVKESAPDHVPALALEGFALLSENRVSAAAQAFEVVLERDSGLADAWFGLGLTRNRNRQRPDRIAAFENAVAIEPERSLFRSYLAKALADQGHRTNAEAQLHMAELLDPNDPTPWLYGAWFDYAQNRVNPAITNVQQSVERNDNLQLFRSRAQLDQDRALRASSLARFYERANLPEVALGEAARAVTANYTDASAHLFLADSYNLLRDPSRFDLHYETAWFNELLLANLLAPVGSGVVSPTLVGQEYGHLFLRDGLHLTSFGEARSDGEFRQLATQSGVFGRTAYAVDLDWAHQDGTRPNNDLDRTEVYVQAKQQIGARDIALLLLKFQDYSSGDNFQYRDPAQARPGYRFDESQRPIGVGLWRHQWTPDVQTLALAGRLENEQQFTDLQANRWLVPRDAAGQSLGVLDLPLDVSYENQFVSWVGELNQIARVQDHRLVVGARFLAGELESQDVLWGSTNLSPSFGDSTGTGLFHQADVIESVQRASLYAYDTLQVGTALWLTAGVAWDQLEKPSNFRHPPLAEGQDRQSHVLPKAAAVWDITDDVTFRGMYAQSLGGVTLDESYRLEPVQLAGFSQSYRTVIPESAGVGSVSGHLLDVGGAALDVRLPTQTYLTLAGTVTRSDVDQVIGVFEFDTSKQRLPQGYAVQAPEHLDFEELGLRATAQQLLGPYCSLGVAYGFKRSELDWSYPAWDTAISSSADLHLAQAHAAVNLPNGGFARAVASWYWQQYTDGWEDLENGESHSQVDLELGWRFPRQRGALSAGIFNLLDEDYRLDPLSGLGELPRERVLFVRLWLNF